MPTQTARKIFAGTGLLIATSAMATEPPQFVSTSASKTSSAAARAEGAVASGLHLAASAVERAASNASKAVNRTAAKLGLPASPSSSAKP